MFSTGTGAGKQRAATAKAIAEQQSALPPGGLFIALYIREDPPKKDDFHWAFYVHTGPSTGMKYHATGSPNTWMASHGSSSNVLKEFLLCVLVEVGRVSPNRLDELDQIMKTHDDELNAIPGLTCRVWIWMIVEKLMERAILQNSGSLDELEHECKAFGNIFSAGASRNEQPRPVVKSELSS